MVGPSSSYCNFTMENALQLKNDTTALWLDVTVSVNLFHPFFLGHFSRLLFWYTNRLSCSPTTPDVLEHSGFYHENPFMEFSQWRSFERSLRQLSRVAGKFIYWGENKSCTMRVNTPFFNHVLGLEKRGTDDFPWRHSTPLFGLFRSSIRLLAWHLLFKFFFFTGIKTNRKAFRFLFTTTTPGSSS